MRGLRALKGSHLTVCFVVFAGCGGNADTSSFDDAGVADGDAVDDGATSLDGPADVADSSPACGVGACAPGAFCTQPAFCNLCACGDAGTWHCEPPSCADSANNCPSSLPAVGSPCPFSEQCFYSEACGQAVANCVGAAWQIQHAQCPNQGCPASKPTIGAACSGPTNLCAYPNSCGGSDAFACVSAVWASLPSSCAACPASEVYSGTACEPAGLSCSWDNGCGGTDVGTCGTDGQWTVNHAGCFPPCPSTPPSSGSSCPAPTQHCSWPVSCGKTTMADCVGASWQTLIATCP